MHLTLGPLSVDFNMTKTANGGTQASGGINIHIPTPAEAFQSVIKTLTKGRPDASLAPGAKKTPGGQAGSVGSDGMPDFKTLRVLQSSGPK